MTDLTQATASELSSLYQSGAASPVTVAEQVLAKIERLNPTLNAFCFTDPDTTIAQAQSSERRWHQGQPLSELDGVPIAIKDSILTQGWPTRHASFAVDPDQSWLEDAPAVARLREAGAVFVGKTTMSEFGSTDYHSDSLLYGPVHNPWNLSHTPGGSSGGSAVAVAAGMVPLALGTDLGGSISVPSAFCGIFGMKSTTGRIPQWPVDVFELSTIGPMSKSINDIALIMSIISRPDIRDSTSLPCDNVGYDLNNKILLSGKRIACVKFKTEFNVDSNIIKSADKIITYLLSQGVCVDLLDLEIETGINNDLPLPKFLQQWLDIPVNKRQLTGREVQHRAILAHKPVDAQTELISRHKSIARMREIMQSYDFVLGPATVVNSVRSNNPVEIVSPLSRFYCITKQPTVTVPVGLDSAGMPMAIMIAGDRYNDAGVLQMAQAIESAFPMSPLFY